MNSQISETTPTPETATQKLASILMERDVREFIREKRSEGRAWRYIARDIYEATNHHVDVTYEAVRKWVADPDA